MKKLLFILLIIAAMTALLAAPALAADLDSVTDAAGLLSGEEWDQLETMAESVSEQYGCGVYIVTVQDYRMLEDTDVQTCAEDLYLYYNLGVGEDQNGILLLLSMEDRDYALVAYGQSAHYAFTDYGKDYLDDKFLDNFRNNDWYGGFYDYVVTAREMLAEAAAGTPIDDYSGDEDYQPMSRGQRTLLGTVIGFVVGLIASAVTCGAFKSQMKNAQKAVGAANYIASDRGVRLNDQYDRFTHQTVHRERIVREQREHGGGGHGGGTTINSHGFSGHSGKF